MKRLELRKMIREEFLKEDDSNLHKQILDVIHIVHKLIRDISDHSDMNSDKSLIKLADKLYMDVKPFYTTLTKISNKMKKIK